MHKKDKLRYLALAEELEGRISSRQLRPGEGMAAETEFAHSFSASRVTVRAALAVLERKGLIERRPGVGTFVAVPRLHHDLSVLENLFAQLAMQGVQAKTRLLEYSWSPIDEVTAKILAHREGMLLRRIWYVDEIPFAVTQTYLHPDTKNVSYADAEQYPGYLILEKLGHHIARADLKMRAEPPSREIARTLGIARSNSIFVLQRTSYSSLGVPLELTKCYLRSDIIEFELEVRGSVRLAAALQNPQSIGVS